MTDPAQEAATPTINMLNEKSLHADLKAWYARAGDRIETHVDGYIVDIIQGDLLVEIQTRNFFAIRRKLARLTERHPIRLVYPIARDKWILKQNADGTTVGVRRKSPKRGRIEDLFAELVSIPTLLTHDRFTLEALLIQEEEVRRPAGPRRRRKAWITHERRLVRVLERRVFETPAQLGALIPDTLAEPFTTADLAGSLAIPRWLAQKMVYCLRQMNAIAPAGKRARAAIYQRNSDGVRSRIAL